MHARVNDQASGAQAFVRQQAEPIDVRAEQAHLVGEPLGVKSPALAEPRQEEIALNGMEILLFEGDCGLQVMSGVRLVKGRGLEARAALLRRLVGVQQVLAGLAICGRRNGLASGRCLLEKRGVRLDDDGRAGNVAEPLGHLGLRTGHCGFGGFDELVSALESVLRIRGDELQDRQRIFDASARLPIAFISVSLFAICDRPSS